MREPWETYFMKLAIQTSTRATCNRLHVGCVIVNKRRIVATGYNGSLPFQPHCDDVGHLFMEGVSGCQRTVHAEVNALAQAASQGTPVKGCDVYVTTLPCFNCMKTLAAAGISRVFYFQTYRHGPPDENLKILIPSIQQVNDIPDAWVDMVATEHFWSRPVEQPEMGEAAK